MRLQALITASGKEMSLADLRIQIEESGVDMDDLIAWITDEGTLAITRDDGDVPGAISIAEIFEENSGLLEEDILLYIGTDDDGSDILCAAPKGELERADLH